MKKGKQLEAVLVLSCTQCYLWLPFKGTGVSGSSNGPGAEFNAKLFELTWPILEGELLACTLVVGGGSLKSKSWSNCENSSAKLAFMLAEGLKRKRGC